MHVRAALFLSLVGSLVVLVACSSTTSAGNGTGGSGSEQSCDAICTHLGDVCNQQAASSCPSTCDRWSSNVRTCMASVSSCTDIASCETASGGTSSGNTSSGGTSTCDGKVHCSSDGRSEEICTMQDGVPSTTSTKCTVGVCKNGACGACSAKSECNTALVCACKDGTNQSVTESGECTGGSCICSWGSCTLTSSVCPARCSSHGGWKGN